MVQTAATAEQVTTLQRFYAYTFLASAFRHPQDGFLDDFVGEPRWTEMLVMIQEFDPAAREALGGWHRRAFASCSLNSDALAQLQAAHARLFGHTVRGQCPPYEMEYGGGEIVQQAPELADISGFYSAFGLTLAPECHERSDHVATECEFMAVLTAKEEWFAREHHEAGYGVVRDAEARFLEAHLGRWLPALAGRIEQVESDGFHHALARFAAAFILRECERLGVASGPPLMDVLPSSPEQDASITCGAEESCPDGRHENLVQVNVHAH